jgi:hypothetical protein
MGEGIGAQRVIERKLLDYAQRVTAFSLSRPTGEGGVRGFDVILPSD